MQFYHYAIIYYIVINIITFFMYGTDKYKAKSNLWRIPERTLILIAFLGGFIGALIGMHFFHHKTRKTKFKILVPLALIIQLILIALLTYNNNHLVVTEYEFNADVDCRIVQISDLHNTYLCFDKNYIVNRVEELDPDIIVITGDIVDGVRTNIDLAVDTASKFSQIADTYYVTGNHEYYGHVDTDALLESLENAGVTILLNDYAIVDSGDSSLALIGLDNNHPSEVTVDYPYDITTVLLNHEPTVTDGYDLILSGHEHGGQIILPGNRPVITSEFELFPDPSKVMGMSNNNNSTLIMNRGIGNSAFPFRINNYPEIVVVNMHQS